MPDPKSGALPTWRRPIRLCCKDLVSCAWFLAFYLLVQNEHEQGRAKQAVGGLIMTFAFVTGPEFVIFVLVVLIAIVPYWKIFSKAGYSGALSLLLFVPLLNIILLFWFAFAEWPIERSRKSGL